MIDINIWKKIDDVRRNITRYYYYYYYYYYYRVAASANTSNVFDSIVFANDVI